MFRSRLHLCSSSNQKSTENAFKAALNNLQNNKQQQHNHPQRDTRKSQFSKSFSNHKHRPSNPSTSNTNNQLDSFIQAFSNKQHQNSSTGSSSTGSGSLINRLKDNLLQQRWANSLSLFDNTSDEVKSAKWKPFHIAPILEVNRKHNRSVDSRREQFEKVWDYMKKHPQQSMDVFSLSEALATACQVREPKPLVEEVKNAISENSYSISLTLSDGGDEQQQRNTTSTNNNQQKQHQEEIRMFAKRIYRNYIASDWESALASVDKFVELVCGVQHQEKQQHQQPQEAKVDSNDNKTQNTTAVVDDDDLEDLDEAAAEAKLAALAATSSKKKTVNSNGNNNKFTALNNIHTFLYHVEDPQALRNTLNFLSQKHRDSSSSSSLLPQPTEQTWAALIHCHGRKGDWQSAMQVLEEMKTNYEQQQQEETSSSNIIIIPRPGPHCYSQVLKSLSKYQSASRTENFVELLQLCEKIVEEMTESQIPHTPDVVEAVVGVFEARQAVHNNFLTKQSPETKSPETDSNNNTTTNLQEWKSSAWYEALSYFSAIKTSTNAKGTRRTYDSLIKMYERRSTDIRDAGKTAQDIYAAMREDGLQPDEQSQVKLINSWSFKKAREIRRKF